MRAILSVLVDTWPNEYTRRAPRRIFSITRPAGQRRKLVLHGSEARLWFVAPLNQAGVLLSACLDGLRFAMSPLRCILQQSCPAARPAVSVLAAQSLVSAEPVTLGPQCCGPLDILNQAVAARDLHLPPVRR